MVDDKDLANLWHSLVDSGLAYRAPAEWSKEEITALYESCVKAYKKANSYAAPYFENGTLRIPHDAPDEIKWWKNDFTDKEKYQLYKRLGVPDEDMHNWMHQRAIDVALGKCDAAGRPLKNGEKE